MPTDRGNISKSILEIIGDKTMCLNEIELRSGSSSIGVRSALRSMVQRGELWRIRRKDKSQWFHVSPLVKKSHG